MEVKIGNKQLRAKGTKATNVQIHLCDFHIGQKWVIWRIRLSWLCFCFSANNSHSISHIYDAKRQKLDQEEYCCRETNLEKETKSNLSFYCSLNALKTRCNIFFFFFYYKTNINLKYLDIWLLNNNLIKGLTISSNTHT